MKCSERIFRLAIKERESGEQKNMGAVVRKIKKDERTNRAARQIVSLAPHLNDPKFRPLIRSYAKISLVTADAAAFLRKRGIVGDDGELRRSVDTFTRLVITQMKLAEKLGLTPGTFHTLSHAKPTLDLETLRAEFLRTDDETTEE